MIRKNKYHSPSPSPQGGHWFLAILFLCSACGRISIGSPDSVSLTFIQRTGKFHDIQIRGQSLPIRTEKSLFFIKDVKKPDDFLPLFGVIRTKQDTMYYLSGSRSLDIDLTVKFIQHRSHLAIEGEIWNYEEGDRALEVAFILPLQMKNAVWWADLNTPRRMSSDAKFTNTVYPIATMNSRNHGIALAIPPDFPCQFETFADARGFGIKMYLGIAKEPLNMSDQTRFKLLLYSVHSRWGFRSGLETYYKLYADRYIPRTEQTGLWLIQADPDEIVNPEHFGFHEIGWAGLPFAGMPERDMRHGILSFPYILAGQTSLEDLPPLPALSSNPGAPVSETTYQRGLFYLRDPASKAVREAVSRHGIHDMYGRYPMVPRYLTWPRPHYAIAFPMNPSPDLYRDMTHTSWGRKYIQQAVRWLDGDAELDGIYVDSMGRWGNYLNYRRDHFPYIRYPLTFNRWGEVAIHNKISHYEFLETLRHELHGRNKLMFVNGLHISKAPDQYGDLVSPRFFQASLCDILSAESGIGTLRSRYEFYRIAAGHKPYLIQSTHWKDRQDVERYLKLGTFYGLYPSMWPKYYAKPGVEWHGTTFGADPPGFIERDLDLHKKYVPLIRTIISAGWEPVTHAHVSQTDVGLERYGGSDKKAPFYFTLFNFGEQQRDVAVTIHALNLNVPGNIPVLELIEQEKVDRENKDQSVLIQLSVPAGDLRVLQVGSRK